MSATKVGVCAHLVPAQLLVEGDDDGWVGGGLTDARAA